MFSSKLFASIAKSLRPVGLAAAALALCSVPLFAQATPSLAANRIVEPINENARVTLPGYVHPLAKASNDRGPAPDSTPLARMHLVLTRSAAQEASLRQLLASMHTPGNASYHKWLTPTQFGQQFGPSDQDVTTVQTWLTAHGFQVSSVEPGKQVIEFTGNVAQFRDAFHAQIHKYVVNGETHFATSGNPQIPSALAPVVAGFVALNNFRPKSHLHVLGQATYDPKTHLAKPEWTYGAEQSLVVTPADFGVEYDLPDSALNPSYAGTKYDGAGQTVAIVNESNINVDLVNQFRTLFGLPANPPTVIIDGNDPGIDGVNDPDGPNYAADETYIDVEWSGAVAPGANIDLVIGADTDLESGLFLAAEHAVYSDVAPIMSLSFGSCEFSLGSTNGYLNALWEQAAAQGITVMVSAGDGGPTGCDDFNSAAYAVDGLAVSGYASTPWDVAVGGTDFYYSDYATGGNSRFTEWNSTVTQNPQASILHYVQEKPWDDSQYGLDSINIATLTGDTTIAGGSGGASSAAVCVAGYNSSTGACLAPTGYPKPSWQTGTGVPADGFRDLPDVSLFASDGSNYSFYPFCYADGDCQTTSNPIQISGAGGTSFAAPAFAGVMALINQKYGAQGQADFVLYPLKAQFPGAFHDITVGTNAVPCNIDTITTVNGTFPPNDCISVSSPLTAVDGTVEGESGVNGKVAYDAAAGYNLATGLGSIDAATLVADWGSVTFKSTSTTLTSPTTGASYTHGQSVTVSGSVTGSGTPAGNVALMTDSSEPGQQGAGAGQLIGGDFSTYQLASGAFSGTTTTLPGGTYDVWASYSGDGTNGASTSAKTQITVSPENSTVGFSLLNAANTSGGVSFGSGSTGVPYGTQGTLDASIYPSTYYTDCVAVATPPSTCASMFFTPATGTVAFTDNGTVINTAAVNVEGDAEFNAPWSVGSHTVTAAYSGDSSYNKSTSSNITFSIVQNQPNIYVGAANENPTLQNFTVVGGQQTIFYVLLENSAESSDEQTYGVGIYSPIAPPTGSVTVAGLPQGTVTATLAPEVDPTDYFVAGAAQVTIPASIPAGTYDVTISYTGDTNYTALTGANSAAGTITVQSSSQTPSTITASLSSTSINPNQSIAVTGTVSGSGSGPAPTGAVYVYPNGDATNAFTVIPGTGNTSSFSGVLTSQTLVQGSNLITLYYSGDANYNSSSTLLNSGNPIVTSGADFSLTPASGIVSVSTTGHNSLTTSATTTISITPTNGFSGTVNLSVPANCGVASGLTCSLSASSVSLTYSNTASLTPQIPAPKNGRWNLLATGGGAALACVLLITIPARRRAWRNLLSLVLFACVAGFGIGCGSSGGGTGCLVNCGGGGGGGGTGTATNPSQSVTLTVTTSGAAVGHYGVTITATGGTNQVHTLGVVAQVE